MRARLNSQLATGHIINRPNVWPSLNCMRLAVGRRAGPDHQSQAALPMLGNTPCAFGLSGDRLPFLAPEGRPTIAHHGSGGLSGGPDSKKSRRDGSTRPFAPLFRPSGTSRRCYADRPPTYVGGYFRPSLRDGRKRPEYVSRGGIAGMFEQKANGGGEQR
jgi:hypothetical protein